MGLRNGPIGILALKRDQAIRFVMLLIYYKLSKSCFNVVINIIFYGLL